MNQTLLLGFPQTADLKFSRTIPEDILFAQRPKAFDRGLYVTT
jgi:hypothetical protein